MAESSLDIHRNLSQPDKIRRHLKQIPVLLTRVGSWRHLMRQTINQFFPQAARETFLYHFKQDYEGFNGTFRVFSAEENGKPEIIAFLREFSKVERVIPAFASHSHSYAPALEIYRNLSAVMQQRGIYDRFERPYAIGGSTSVDETLLLNNGFSYRANTGELIDMPATASNKGGIAFMHDGARLFTASEARDVRDDAAVDLITGTSLAFDASSGEKMSTEELWVKALSVCDANGYWSSDNSMFGFLTQSDDGFRYYNVHFDPNHLSHFQREIDGMFDCAGTPVQQRFMLERAHTVLAVRLLLEHLQHQASGDSKVVALEENYAIKPRHVDDIGRYLDEEIIYPAELLLYPARR
ncbi:MAG: hypothetical protein TR69_WS6001000079 [candidate division WS6 bacterium OLB20]|uniref:Uncharacterized protein n=1 Tax=candidate division WS6 bacterium OLB20 TaxID=1617426 RepID=A0A136M154_9BACT|nr:MAG: hypothetical protein TR69_WS6001000079 [candidate division WS6 bacterium OLB20]